jgi:FtsX-like permease family protein
VIRFALRLTFAGGREAAARLLITAAAVALGVGLLLATLAGINAVNAQNARYAWQNSGVPAATEAHAVPSPDPAYGTFRYEHHDGRTITRIDVAATGPRSPVPPGIPRLPAPGEYYASPAMSALLRTTPAAELGDRYPGRRAGVIGAAALPSPDSLIVIVGRTVADLSHAPRVTKVTSIATKTPSSCDGCNVGTDADSIDLILSVTAAALLFPLLIFIGTVTRLTAARREQRFAAMRLIGATPRQVSLVSAVESGVAAVIGAAGGFGLFFLFRGRLAAFAPTGERFWAGDLSLTPLQVVLVAAGVPLGAAVAARVALRRVRISPLGVTRRVTPRPPRAYRLIPLVAGVAELTYFVGRRPETTSGQIWAYLTGIFLMMGGLVVAGPWLTMVGSRALARHARRPATLIAGRRLADDPKAGYRAVSGLVLALFVTSTAVGVIDTMVAERGVPTGDAAARGTLLADYSEGWTATPGVPRSSVPPVPEPVLARLRAIPGVRGVVQIHTNPLGTTIALPGDDLATVGGLMSCREAAGVPAVGGCAAGAGVALVRPYSLADEKLRPAGGWPAAALPTGRVRRLPVQAIAVGTDGSSPAIERVRTALTLAYPYREPAATLGERQADVESARQLRGYERLADVVVLSTLCIAGCALAAGVVGGLNERKRPFSLLRLAGVRTATLRRAVILESAVPLLLGAIVASGAGFLAAGLFVRSQLDYSLHPPGAGYVGTVLGGLAVSLGVIASTLPVLRRITGPETARNE